MWNGIHRPIPFYITALGGPFLILLIGFVQPIGTCTISPDMISLNEEQTEYEAGA